MLNLIYRDILHALYTLVILTIVICIWVYTLVVEVVVCTDSILNKGRILRIAVSTLQLQTRRLKVEAIDCSVL